MSLCKTNIFVTIDNLNVDKGRPVTTEEIREALSEGSVETVEQSWLMDYLCKKHRHGYLIRSQDPRWELSYKGRAYIKEKTRSWHWVSVKDRLPRDNQLCLMFDPRFDVNSSNRYRLCKGGMLVHYKDSTHWMELEPGPDGA